MQTNDQRNQTVASKTEQREYQRLTLNLWPDVGRALGIGRNATFKAAKAGQIPTIKIGKRILVPRAAFETLLNGVAVGLQ
jgi:hypothetical protein